MAAMGNFCLTFGWMAIKGYRIHIYCSTSFTDILVRRIRQLCYQVLRILKLCSREDSVFCLWYIFLFYNVSDVDKVRVPRWACVNLRVTQLQEEVCVVEINVTKSDGMKVTGLSVSLPPPRLPHWPFQYTVHTPETVRQRGWKSVVFIPLLIYTTRAYSLFLAK
jgi:hypothetical protein